MACFERFYLMDNKVTCHAKKMLLQQLNMYKNETCQAEIKKL